MTSQPHLPRRRKTLASGNAHTDGAGYVHNLVVADVQKILVTGAAGKVGQAFIGRLLASGEDRFAGFTVRALCHNRILEAGRA